MYIEIVSTIKIIIYALKQSTYILQKCFFSDYKILTSRLKKILEIELRKRKLKTDIDFKETKLKNY